MQEHGLTLTDLQIRNIFMFLSAVGVYQYFSVHSVHFTLELTEQSFIEEGLPKYPLEQIEIVDFESNNVVNYTYLPQANPFLTNEFAISAIDASEQTSEIVMAAPVSKREKNKSLIPARQEPSAIPRLLKQAVIWPADAVIFGNDNRNISIDDTYEMRADYFPKNTRYFGFFNQKALRAQGLNENDKEWKDYFARIEHGQVVSPKGETGVKALKPPILTDVKINRQRFGHHLFRWSAKTIGTLNRLLGDHCATQLDSNGTQYKLVDYCWHRPVGPGH